MLMQLIFFNRTRYIFSLSLILSSFSRVHTLFPFICSFFYFKIFSFQMFYIYSALFQHFFNKIHKLTSIDATILLKRQNREHKFSTFVFILLLFPNMMFMFYIVASFKNLCETFKFSFPDFET